MTDEEKGTERKVAASSGVFGLLLVAYHGNDCLDPSHLGSRPEGSRIIKARRLVRMEKETKRVREERREKMGMRGGRWWLQMMPQLVWC